LVCNLLENESNLKIVAFPLNIKGINPFRYYLLRKRNLLF
jgi:hypothetical protein